MGSTTPSTQTANLQPEARTSTPPNSAQIVSLGTMYTISQHGSPASSNCSKVSPPLLGRYTYNDLPPFTSAGIRGLLPPAWPTQYIILGSLHVDSFPPPWPTASPSGMGTAQLKPGTTSRPYDCSDPSEVQAYSSVPASHCSTWATPRSERTSLRSFQLLQKEKKRYLTAYVCFLSRTGHTLQLWSDGHLELDPMHWSFSVPQRVTVEQCLTWLQHTNLLTRLPLHPDARKGFLLSHPTGRAQLRHLPGVRKNFAQAPALLTDQVIRHCLPR